MATNWSPNIVPKNSVFNTFNVTINAGGTASYDLLDAGNACPDPSVPVGACISTLVLGNNHQLNIIPDTTLTVLGQTDLFGIINGTGGDFIARTASFPGNRARVYGANGSRIVIGAATYSSTGVWTGGSPSYNPHTRPLVLLSASDAGALLDLSSL